VLGLPHSVAGCPFDLDGVLIPTAKIHAGAWKAMFDPHLSMRAAAFGNGDRLTVIACCAAPGTRFARQGPPTPPSKDQR
jgi:hypothetical protein